MDQYTFNLVNRFIDLNNKQSPDGKPLCAFIVQGDAVYMQERRFDPSTGLEVGPLLSVIDPGAVAELKGNLTSISQALDSVSQLVVPLAATIAKIIK